MISMIGTLLKIKQDTFKGSQGDVTVQKLDVLDLDGTVSKIHSVTDYELKTKYSDKLNQKISLNVIPRVYTSKNGIAGLQWSVNNPERS